MKASNIVMRAHMALAIALFLFAANGAALAQEPLKLFELTIPDRVAGLPHGQPHDYEKTAPGLGYSVHFQRPDLWIDVYLYDRRKSNIPENPNSEVIKQELEQAKSDVFEVERRGLYTNVVMKDDYAIGRDGRMRFLCSTFTYVVLPKNFGAADSYLCVTGWKHKFFKIRMTTRRNKDSSEEAEKFINAWIDVLWP